METTSYIALSRQMVLRREMDIVANNIANANTPAYKGERMVFREYLAQANRGEKLSFVQDIGLARDFREGPMTKTDNPFDLAINGEGYFIIDTPLGERYTRHGRFQIDANGQLVTGQGYPVRGEAGPINVPFDQGEINIASDGTLSTADGTFANLAIVTFEDQQALKRAANNLYIADEEEPAPVEQPHVVQGMLEDSNVEPVLELTRMMTVMREYQSVGKFIQQEHDRQKKAIERLGRPGS